MLNNILALVRWEGNKSRDNDLTAENHCRGTGLVGVWINPDIIIEGFMPSTNLQG